MFNDNDDSLEFNLPKLPLDFNTTPFFMINLTQNWFNTFSSFNFSFFGITVTFHLFKACSFLILHCFNLRKKFSGEKVKTQEHPKMEEAAIDLSINTKNVFSSALRFAMSIDTLKNSPEVAHELKTSAQEQVEFMLSGDQEEVRLLISEEEVKSVVRLGISNVVSTLLERLSSLLLLLTECPEFGVLTTLYDVEWLCKVLPRMELMKDLVFKWADISSEILVVAENCQLDSRMLGVKVKLVEVTGKILEVVGYGMVIVPSRTRACLLKKWLPFIRRLKTLVDAEGSESEYKMDEDLCEFIEGSMVSLVLTLPSNDQAEVFEEWMRGIGLEAVKFPDLSEAFEVWCYRSKSAKRRLLERCDRLSSENLDL